MLPAIVSSSVFAPIVTPVGAGPPLPSLTAQPSTVLAAIKSLEACRKTSEGSGGYQINYLICGTVRGVCVN
jgi:hypothetical protein